MGDIRRDWPHLTGYQRFETAVGLGLTLIIAAVIALLAVVRKLIVVDFYTVTPASLAAFAGFSYLWVPPIG
jgi:hypothetical protein